MEEYKLIISLTTYPKRFERFSKNINSIIENELPDGFTKNDILYVINIDDNIDVEYQNKYNQIKDDLINKGYKVKVENRDSRWRPANKFIHVSKEYPDLPIITVDDDIYYPNDVLKLLYEEWLIHPDCIICHESNPVIFEKEWLKIINNVTLKIGFSGFDKYLTNCCLFPPNALENTEAYDLDGFKSFCNAQHDELWFWIHTTLKGIQVRTLPRVFSFVGEGNMAPDETALCNVNAPNWELYNNKINQFYGSNLCKAVYKNRVKIYVNSSSFWFLLGFWGQIIKFFCSPYRINFIMSKDIGNSYLKVLLSMIKRSPLTECIITSEREEFKNKYCDVDRFKPINGISEFTKLEWDEVLNKEFKGSN